MANLSPAVVSDIVILSGVGSLPHGYHLLEPPFVIEGSSEKRYLAYKTSTPSHKTYAVTDIVVKKDTSLIPPGYKTLSYTTPDELECFPNKLLLLKRDGWSPVLKGIPNALTDVMLLRKVDRDDLPFGYKMIGDINGLCICYKRSDLKYAEEYVSDDDDVFGEFTASDDEDFYEIPSSVKSRPSQGNDETDGRIGGVSTNSTVPKKKSHKKIIKSAPIRDTSNTSYSNSPMDSIVLSPLYTNVHLPQNTIGYPVDQFLAPPPSSVLCSKCNHVLRGPYQLLCCKCFICEACLLTLQQSSNAKCRKCSSLDYDFKSCLEMRETVDLLLVKCTNAKLGCKWEGQLGEMEVHICITCLYAEVTCESNCGLKFLRRDLDKHQCINGGQESASKSLHRSASSVEELSQRISQIQRKQSEEMQAVKQELRQVHRHSTKGSIGSEGNYARLSLEVKTLKKQLADSAQREQAMEARLKEHEEQIRILKETHNIFRLQFDNLIDQLQTKPLPGQQLPLSPVASPTTLKQPPCEFVIEQFDRYLHTPDAEWYSEPFVSDIHGYKFCLQVVPHGMLTSAGSEISICVKLMRGEYDDQLKWPFQGKITVQILNWICDQRHASRVIEFNPDARRYGACGRVPSGCIGDRATKGWGIVPFLPHGYLPFNRERNTEFTRDNCMCIRVVNVTVL